MTKMQYKVLNESFQLQKWTAKWDANKADSNWLLLGCYFVIRFETYYFLSFVSLK